MWKPPRLEAVLILLALMCVAGVAVPMLTRYSDNAARLRCLENLRIIGEAIREWSALNDYALPPGRGMSGFCNSTTGEPLRGNLYAIEPGLNALWDKGRGVIKDVNVFRCPGDRTLLPPPQIGEDFTSARQLSYGMTGNLYPADPPNKVIVADKSDKSLVDGAMQNTANHNHRLTNVLFLDGRAMSVDKPYLPPGLGSELGSIYIRESGEPNDTYIE